MKKLLFLVISILCLVFSLWLMWHTLSYDPAARSILIGSKYWSDFGGHLPLIRSFSMGDNWPPEYPSFPGEPIRYHFLFYYLSGILERAGLRLDWALNLPSVAGFFLLLLLIFALSKRLFSKTSVALLSIVFFLFNGSFSWLDFIKKYPISSLPSLTQFPSFGPWNGSDISAFWNLNIYTNQRHLGLSFALILFLIYALILEKKKHLLLTGSILGSFLLLNQVAFAIGGIFIGWFFLLRPTIRKSILISLIGLIPWLALSRLIQSTPVVHWQPGFLTQLPITIPSLLKFWFLNAGWHLFLIPLGFVLAPKRSRILIVPLLVLFIVPNLFRLSVDIINNHKFFNFYFIVGDMFSAYAVFRIWQANKFGKFITPAIILFLILGGIVDFFPVKNDFYIPLPDTSSNPDARYILEHTPPNTVVLNSNWYYHPASIAGRKIFNVYPYFGWALGYDQAQRERETIMIYRSSNKASACMLLLKNDISFVELNPHPENFLQPNYNLWDTQFFPAYTNSKTKLKIYSVEDNCLNNGS